MVTRKSLFLLWATFVSLPISVFAGTSTEGDIEEYASYGDISVLEINEVQVSNIDQFIDYSYNYGGWIELYNPTNEQILLDGLCVSDDVNDPQKFTLPQGFGSIDAKGYMVVFFGNNAADGNYGNTAYKQVDFKLSYDGGTIFIASSEGDIISSVDYPGAIARCSYARVGDNGDEWGMTGEPTPGSTNATSTYASERLVAPEVSVASCLFTDAFSIKVDIPSGATLRYTTDGSTPTATNGNTSTTGDFYVSSTTIYRFCLIEKGYLPSKVITRSYIYRDKDYYLPVISIATADANLYDDTIGVYVDGKNGISGNNHGDSNLNMDWKRPVNFEYITPDNEMGVNMETDFEVAGGWSRHWAPASFKLKATKSYEGLTSIDYPFFSLRPYNKYKQILVRNGGNDNDSASKGRVRDGITQQVLMSSGVYVDAQDYQPVHVFFNGTYMGMLNLREPNNRYHGTANYGYDDDEMDAFEYSNGGYIQKAGTKDQFTYWRILSESAANQTIYENICNVIDIDEFINYWAALCYLGSNDWITNNNNVKGYRSLPDGKFHLTVLDQDSAWNTRDMVSTVDGNRSNELLIIYNNMKKNASFQRQFVDAYCIMCGSVFTADRCQTIGDSICRLVEKALAMEGRQPWTSYYEQSTNMTSSSSRATRINSLRTSYGLSQGMDVTFSGNVPSSFRINGQYVPTSQFSGTLFAPVEIEASAGAGYNFVGWKRTDINSEPIICSDRTITLDSDTNINLLAVFEPIIDDYRIEAGATPVVVNEVSASNSVFVNEYWKRNDWIELYNTTDDIIDIEGMFLSDNINNPYKYQITSEGTEASTLIAPHGYLVVWADKLSPFTQLHSSFSLANDDDEVVILTAEDSSWADTLIYVAHIGEESVGRYPDGGRRVYKMTKPSIAATNWINTSAEWISGEDVNFDDGTPLAISTLPTTAGREPVVEYYTTDGVRLSNPRRGVNIVRRIDSSGNITTRKIVVQ